MQTSPRVHWLGQVEYLTTLQAMRAFTARREANTQDELWVCQHAPTFTLGLASKPEHLLAPGDIAVVQSDRGGQVTYHGPGQVVLYALIDLRRAGYFVKELVYRMEAAVLKTLGQFGLTGHRVAGAPGIYLQLADPGGHAALSGPRPATEPFRGLGKIAALGVKVSRHCSYHGLALNVQMDLEPFSRINPCGYPGLKTIDLSTMGVPIGWQEAADLLSRKLATHLTP